MGERDDIRAELAEVRRDLELVQDLLIAVIERRDCVQSSDLLNERGRAEQAAVWQKFRALRQRVEAR